VPTNTTLQTDVILPTERTVQTQFAFPLELQGGVWHTTSSERYQYIQSTGRLLPDPPIANSERWKADCGTEYLPYVRYLGGISLFEFNGFDPSKYSERCPMSSWQTFVPFRQDWGKAIWIEIDATQLGRDFICVKELLRMWKHARASSHTIMPGIEAASLTPISVALFKRVLEISAHGLYNISSKAVP
jgi:hypothetical protein